MIMTATVMLTKLAMNVMVKMKMVMMTTTMKTMVSLRANKKDILCVPPCSFVRV